METLQSVRESTGTRTMVCVGSWGTMSSRGTCQTLRTFGKGCCLPLPVAPEGFGNEHAVARPVARASALSLLVEGVTVLSLVLAKAVVAKQVLREQGLVSAAIGPIH
jgi:hypothetical protein